jgi:hypothetical protein
VWSWVARTGIGRASDWARRRAGLAAVLVLLGAALAPEPSRAEPSRAGPGAEAHPELDLTRLRQRLDALQAQRPAGVPQGALESIAYNLDVTERIVRNFPTQGRAWAARAQRFLDLAEAGQDPIVAERGKILMRGYRSELSTVRQGYAVYIPKNYDPSRSYPLMLMLHGGSANGNLFLAVVLGNNMSWLEYPIHLWDDLQPRWSPDWIVVAPDGFGQVMWRWMGERDVLDVLDDVQRHYNVDPERVVLGGLSNGGVGAYNIGMRHAWRFSAVTAIAGAPSWLQYSGGVIDELQARGLHPLSGMSLIENAHGTDFRYYHGHFDTGPMKPRFVEELRTRIDELKVPASETWFDEGHDLLYRVHGHGKIYDKLAGARRQQRPAHVVLVTGDYRAARQHWLSVTRLISYPELARVEGQAADAALQLTTDNVSALAIDLRDAPTGTGPKLQIRVDGASVYDGPRAALGHVLNLVRDAHGWRTGLPADPAGALVKKPGSSGPIADAYYDGMVHVYGTARPEHTDALKHSAERGAHGWPLWLWRHEQRVVPDTAVDEALLRSSHLVLYGTPGANSVLERIASQLPIRVENDGVRVGDTLRPGAELGTRFVYPNPLAPGRYVIVQAGPTPAAVDAGHRLPDFLPDYVVYDARTLRSRPRLLFDKARKPVALGYFDGRWQLPAKPEGADDVQATEVQGSDVQPADIPATTAADGGVPLLPIPPAPRRPAAPASFAAPEDTQAGQAAREIARRVPTFMNYRALTPGGSWLVDPAARWSVRTSDTCLEALRSAGVRARATTTLLPTPVPAPVELLGRVGGVWFRSSHPERPVLMACELAAKLPALARIVASHGVRGIDVMSSYREQPRPSFHTLGLALDLWRFWTLKGAMSVARDFEATPLSETCKAPKPSTGSAKVLLDIACKLAQSRSFATVLTPNYNEGHRDHFHLDIRPDDPRVFVR